MSRQAKEIPARSYLSTAAFHLNFFTYSTSKHRTTFKVTGDLSAVAGATSVNCPSGRVLRENGRKLFPPAHPIDTVNGVPFTFPSTVMVGVFDNQSGLSGFIDPNSPIFAVYNTDLPNYLKDSVDPVGGKTDLGPPTLTYGRVAVGSRLILNSGNTGVVDMSTGTVIGSFRKVTVNAEHCRSSSVIMLTYAGQNNPGVLSAEGMRNGFFEVVSSSLTDAGNVMYMIVN